MGALEALKNIEAEMVAVLGRFRHTRDGIWIANGDQAGFIGLVLEASDIMSELHLHTFSIQLNTTATRGRVNFSETQSYASVEECIGIVRSAIRKIMRGPVAPISAPKTEIQTPFVSFTRIQELKSIKSTFFDFRRLIRMCEEVNISFAAENYISTAALLRAIKDHLPPALGAPNFAQYASQCDRSLKGSMEHLERSMKHVADQWLHGQIRARESLPTAQQVDFRQDIDVLLAEVVRRHQ